MHYQIVVLLFVHFLCVHIFMGHFISEGADLWSQPGTCITLDKLFNLFGV